jgi:hypothetical protein
MKMFSVVYPANVRAALVQYERAVDNDGVDPVSGFSCQEIISWLEAVAKGEKPAHPLARQAAVAALRRGV